LSKRALILCGGGLTGAFYEMGALAALNDFFYEDEFNVNKFDIYIGVSAGSILASVIANQISAKEIYKGILSGGDNPFNFRREDIYGPSFFGGLKLLWTLGINIPVSALFQIIQQHKHFTLVELADIIQEKLPSGIFSLKRMQRFLEKNFKQHQIAQDFRKVERELYIPATHVDTGERWVFGEKGLDHISIPDAITASSSIPMFFTPHKIEGYEFFDGTIGNIGHLDVAIRHGADLIFVISPTIPLYNDLKRVCIPSLHGKRCATISEKGLFYIWRQSRKTEAHHTLLQEIDNTRHKHKGVDIVLIKPEATQVDMFLHAPMSFSAKIKIINYAYNSTIRFLKEDMQHINVIMKKHHLKGSLRHTYWNRFFRLLRWKV